MVALQSIIHEFKTKKIWTGCLSEVRLRPWFNTCLLRESENVTIRIVGQNKFGLDMSLGLTSRFLLFRSQPEQPSLS